MKKITKKIVDAPEAVLEQSVSFTKETTYQLDKAKITKTSKKYWETLGPGLVTGASDDDPSGIATYSQAGAQYGPQLLWLSVFTLPFLGVVQEMCARIAIVTGRGLASNIKRLFSRKILYFAMVLLFIANTLNIGADLGAMAKATQLVLPKLPFGFLVILFGVGGLLLEIFLSYRVYAKYLKWMTLVLLSYVLSLFLIHTDWSTVLSHTFLPSFSLTKDSLFIIMAILGTTISPYLFFWQTSQEVEEEILEGKRTIKERQKVDQKDLTRMRSDVWSGMIFSNFVMFAIMVVCAGTLYVNGITNIQTATDAALALKPIAGNGAFVLFALGIIGTGLLAIPVLAASLSYTVAESFSWREGLYQKLRSARSFYGVMALAMIVGLGINFLNIDPIKALLYSAIANGLIAPVILVCILLIAGNKKVMGEHTNNFWSHSLGWIITVIMAIAGVATIISLFVH